MLIPLVSLPAQEPLVGYSAAASDHQRRLETELRAAADPGSALHHMEALSSAPHVAGAAALLLDLFPSTAPEDIVQLLVTTATDLGETGLEYCFACSCRTRIPLASSWWRPIS